MKRFLALFGPTRFPCNMMFVLLNNSTTSATNVSGIAYPDPSGSTRTSSIVFSGILVAQSLVFYIVLCGQLLYFCAWNVSTSLTYGLGMSLLLWLTGLECLYFFDLLLITHLVSSIYSWSSFVALLIIKKWIDSERTENNQHLSKRSIYHQEHYLKSQPTRIGNRSHSSLISVGFVKRNICTHSTRRL